MQEFDASQHLEELGELWERPAMAERATKRPYVMFTRLVPVPRPTYSLCLL